MNKVMLIGNLTKDFELKQTKSGIDIVTGSIATNKIYTDKNGQKQQETEFHNLVGFGKVAEILSKFTKKGDKIYIEGEIKTDRWEDESGVKKSNTKIVIQTIEFLQNKSDNQKNADEIDVEDLPF